jgi:hypothetical protein
MPTFKALNQLVLSSAQITHLCMHDCPLVPTPHLVSLNGKGELKQAGLPLRNVPAAAQQQQQQQQQQTGSKAASCCVVST